MKEICTVEIILWGNTNNSWKPSTTREFSSFEAAKDFVKKEKEYSFSHLHQYNLSMNLNNY